MPLSAGEAGNKLAEYLKRAKMQQKELANRLGIEPSYISRMVKGHINWTTGQYFGQIASYLYLSNEEIKILNPAAVVEFLVKSENNSANPINIPDSVINAAELYKDIDPLIAEQNVQIFMAKAGDFEGGPSTPQEWIRYFNDIRYWLHRGNSKNSVI